MNTPRRIPMKQTFFAGLLASALCLAAGPGAAPVAIIGVEGAACHEDREWARLSTVQAYADLLESFGRSFAGEGAR